MKAVTKPTSVPFAVLLRILDGFNPMMMQYTPGALTLMLALEIFSADNSYSMYSAPSQNF